MKTILARLLLGAVVLSAPLVVLFLELPANVFAGCGLYGYGCEEPVCFGVEVTTDSGSTWRDGQVYVFGAPGSQISITVRTVLSVSSGDIQGWSFGVSPDASALVGVNGGDFV